jgi:hypothetical protein
VALLAVLTCCTFTEDQYLRHEPKEARKRLRTITYNQQPTTEGVDGDSPQDQQVSPKSGELVSSFQSCSLYTAYGSL